MLAEGYELAILKASGETGLYEAAFPVTFPYTIDQILDLRFFPGEL